MATFGFRPPSEGLTVWGEAVRTMQPDLLELALEVHSAAPSAMQGLRDNSMKLMQISQAMLAAGIPQSEMQASTAAFWPLSPGLPPSFSVPQLPGIGVNPYGLVAAAEAGFHVVNYLKLSVREMNRVGEILDTAMRAGAGINSRFLYRVRDESSVRRGLLEAAGRDARGRADALAGALGKSVGDPINVWEDFTAYYMGAPLADGGWRPTASTPISPGELTYVARVNVTFRVQ